MEGIKFDDNKLLWSLVPWEPMHEVAKVLTDGAKKYTADNWMKVDVQRYREALLRHSLVYQGGEKVDPDSGSHHLAHVVANALIIMWHENHKEKTVKLVNGDQTVKAKHYIVPEGSGSPVEVKPGQTIKYLSDTIELFTPEWCAQMVKEARPL